PCRAASSRSLAWRSLPDGFGGLALLRRERHEAAIAPGAALVQPIRRQRGAPLLLELAEQPVVGPGERPVLGLDRLVQRPVAAQIIGDAARRVEIDRLERPHERPAQTDAVLDRGVD